MKGGFDEQVWRIVVYIRAPRTNRKKIKELPPGHLSTGKIFSPHLRSTTIDTVPPFEPRGLTSLKSSYTAVTKWYWRIIIPTTPLPPCDRVRAIPPLCLPSTQRPHLAQVVAYCRNEVVLTPIRTHHPITTPRQSSHYPLLCAGHQGETCTLGRPHSRMSRTPPEPGGVVPIQSPPTTVTKWYCHIPPSTTLRPTRDGPRAIPFHRVLHHGDTLTLEYPHSRVSSLPFAPQAQDEQSTDASH